MKKIQYYRTAVYGKTVEYVSDKNDARYIAQLTGQKTVNQNIRGLLQTISAGSIQFVETVMPDQNL